jgi:hypothetical protein
VPVSYTATATSAMPPILSSIVRPLQELRAQSRRARLSRSTAPAWALRPHLTCWTPPAGLPLL